MAPSRLLWFLVGAGTATWWIKRPLANYNREGRFFFEGGPGHVTYGRRTVRQEGDQEPQVNETFKQWEFGGQDEERRKEIVKEWSRLAGDRAAEITEVTLEALNSLTQTLQIKLAEHRAAQEAEERRRQEQLENPNLPQRGRSASEPSSRRWV